MINNYCVIGSPVFHSLSPLIYNTLYKRYNIINCRYTAVEVTPECLKSFLDNTDSENIKGFNITMPLKTYMLPYLTYIDFTVLNGCNTVKATEHGFFGYSTDALGFYKSLTLRGYDYKEKNVVFLGCGGVTRALIKDAVQKGADKVIVVNRTLSKLDDLPDTIIKDKLSNWHNYLPECDILINTTPMGMKQYTSLIDYNELNNLKEEAVVCDLIYDPPKTPMLETAEKMHHYIINGLDMLIWQAFYAFEIFFGVMPDMDDYRTIKELILQ